VRKDVDLWKSVMTQSQNSFSVKLSSCLTCAAVSMGKWPLNERFIVALVSVPSVKESRSVCFLSAVHG